MARGMTFLGLRDSSPYMAVDSKPTQDQKAKKRPRPAEEPVKAFTGLIGSTGMPSGPPPAMSTAVATAKRTAISATNITPSALAVRLMSKYDRMAVTASMTAAYRIHGTSTPNWSATVVLAKYAKTPTMEASKTM